MAFQVSVRINTNTVEALSVASSSKEFEKFTIGKLKEKVLSLFPGVNDLNRLRVIFGQDEPGDHQTFKSCKIEHLSFLVVVVRMPKGQGAEAQRRVSEAAGFTRVLERWRQIDAGKHLEDDKTLRDYGIKHESAVQMVQRLHIRESCTIYVKTITGNTIPVYVDPEELENMTVKEFRRRLDPTGQMKRYRLIFEGRHLEDDKTLRDYGIKHESAGILSNVILLSSISTNTIRTRKNNPSS